MTAQPIQDHRTEAAIENVRNRISVIEDLNARGIGTALWHQQFELSCLRALLAAHEQEPIGAFHISGGTVEATTDYCKDGEWPIQDGIVEVYARPAPSIPAAVPDIVGKLLAILDRHTVVLGWGEKPITLAELVVARDGSDELDACRAAMLQSETVVRSDERLMETPCAIGIAPGVDYDFCTAKAGSSTVITDGWRIEAERLSELYGQSFVVFRNGEEPRCADPTKVIISFTDKGLGYGSFDRSPAIPDDTRRMDWLVSKTVNVREPQVYGSHDLFWSQTISEDWEEEHKTTLREQIDAAMDAAPKGV